MKKRLILQLSLVLILFAIAVLLFIFGKGHTFLIDNRKVQFEGETLQAFDNIKVYINNNDPLEIEGPFRDMTTAMGVFHKIKVEILDDDYNVMEVIEKNFNLGLENTYIISIPLLYKNSSEWLTVKE